MGRIPALLLTEFLEYLEAVVRSWPGLSGVLVRRLYYRCRLKRLGRKVVISPGVRFCGHRYISIGDDTHIDSGCTILAGPPSLEGHEVRRLKNAAFDLAEGEVAIGKAVHLAPGCLIVGHGGVQIGDFSGCTAGSRIFSISNHYAGFADPSRRDILFTTRAGPRSYIIGPVVLGRNVGVALNAVILPGTTLGDESFLGIGSVGRGAIPPNTVAAGNPAVPIKDRFAAPRTESRSNESGQGDQQLPGQE